MIKEGKIGEGGVEKTDEGLPLLHACINLEPSNQDKKFIFKPVLHKLLSKNIDL